MAITDIRGASLSLADPPISTNPNPDLAWKAPVRVATTGSNITLSGLQTIDGVALAAGDRVLVKDQTDQTTNGLYNAATGPWTRTIDANNNSQWTQGTSVIVAAGTLNAGRIYETTTINPIILGTSNLTFSLVPLTNVVGDPTGTVDSSAAINSAMASGGTVTLVPGVYKLTASVNMGSGSNGVASLAKPVKLVGQGAGAAPSFPGTPTPSVKFLWAGSAGGTMMVVNGPLQGWGIDGIEFDGNNSAGVCLQIISAQYGACRGCSFTGFTNIGLDTTAWSARPGGWGNVDNLHNLYENLVFVFPGVVSGLATAGSKAIVLTGNAGILDNTAYETFINTIIIFPGAPGVTLYGIFLQFCDSCSFLTTHIVNGDTNCVCVNFDYTFDPSNNFPTSNFFFNLDAAGSPAPPIRFQNAGSPGLTQPNMVIGLDQTNGVTFANATLAGLTYLAPTGMSLGGVTIDASGYIKSNAAIATNPPNTQTGSGYVVLETDSSIINNNAAAALTLTLPSPATFSGRWLHVKTTQNQAVFSNAANVVPLAGGAATSAIVAGTAGKWAELQSNTASSWIIMASN